MNHWPMSIDLSAKELTIEVDGRVERYPLDNLPSFDDGPTGPPSLLLIDIRKWKRRDSSEYRTIIGLPQRSDAHAVYEADHGGTRYLIPAFLFINRLCPPFKKVAPKLFSPNALSLLSSPIVQEGRIVDALASTRNSGEKNSVVERRSRFWRWSWTFPTGTRFIKSIYFHALDGRLDFDLPAAAAYIYVQGHRKGDAVAVTHIDPNVLVALEEPLAWARVDSRLFPVRKPLNMKGRKEFKVPKHLSDELFASLSDDEWALTASIFPPIKVGSSSPVTRRHEIDLIFETLRCGQRVTSLPRQTLVRLRALKRDGIWQRFVNEVARTRGLGESERPATAEVFLEFPHAISLEGRTKDEDLQFEVEDTTYRLPVSLLIEALVPSNGALHRLLQKLEGSLRDELEVRLDGKYGRRGAYHALGHASSQGVLDWAYHCPGAEAFLQAIQDSSPLPELNAIFHAQLNGVWREAVFFIKSMTVGEIISPFSLDVHHKSIFRVLWLKGHVKNGRSHREPNLALQRQDGTLELRDQEWNGLRASYKALREADRPTLNLLIELAHDGRGAIARKFPARNERHALHKRLSSRGVFNLIMADIEAMRAVPGVSS